MGHFVESSFIYRGLRCVCIATDMGHRCGYVGVRKNHPLYGHGYSEKILAFSDVSGSPIGKRGVIPLFCIDKNAKYVGMDLYFDVHGGVTFADGGKNCKYPVKSSLWWIGFDCAHSGDSRDESLCKKSTLDIIRRFGNDHGEVRTKEYVEQECRNLADQILEITEVY